MSLVWLDHVNIRTANLDTMVGFYRDVLGLMPGPRPSFSFNGAWLYCADKAAVHLVETSAAPVGGEPQIEHFAFRAEDLAGFLRTLETRGVSYRMAVVPGLKLRQVHVRDPDGNHVEVSFSSQEGEAFDACGAA
jgi:catechol 2,3-dioxygenase-like lactoylglutathione lyase family enzyme